MNSIVVKVRQLRVSQDERRERQAHCQINQEQKNGSE